MKQSVSIRVAALMAMSLGAGSALAVDVAASPTLSKIKSSGAISIGHRTSLEEHHDTFLDLTSV